MMLTFFRGETSICHWWEATDVTAVTVNQHDDDTKRQTILRLITYLSLILLSLSSHLHSSSTFLAKYEAISLLICRKNQMRAVFKNFTMSVTDTKLQKQDVGYFTDLRQLLL